MSEIDVRIIKLEPARVASAHGFGESPEGEAWDKLLGWARAQGLEDAIQPGRFFGFNNPDPAPGSPNYGYEQWMTLTSDDDVAATDDVTIKDFDGGKYAVTACKLPEIGEAWQQLVMWVESHGYQIGTQPCLEEMRSPIESTDFENMAFNIYQAIAE